MRGGFSSSALRSTRRCASGPDFSAIQAANAASKWSRLMKLFWSARTPKSGHAPGVNLRSCHQPRHPAQGPLRGGAGLSPSYSGNWVEILLDFGTIAPLLRSSRSRPQARAKGRRGPRLRPRPDSPRSACLPSPPGRPRTGRIARRPAPRASRTGRPSSSAWTRPSLFPLQSRGYRPAYRGHSESDLRCRVAAGMFREFFSGRWSARRRDSHLAIEDGRRDEGNSRRIARDSLSRRSPPLAPFGFWTQRILTQLLDQKLVARQETWQC